MHKIGPAIIVIAILCSLAAPRTAFAWGAEGHRIVALIAADQLTPTAKAQVNQLLGTDDAAAGMMAVSTWADEIRRNRPNTAPWHFTDIPIGSAGYDAQRDCTRGQCSIAQIQTDERILADQQLLAPVRAEALRFLIHFIGDLHQPLHSSNHDDRGGNQIHVLLGKRHTNMHAVWDVDTVRALGRSPEEVARSLELQISATDKAAWSQGNAMDWANETFGVASRVIYANLQGSGDTAAPIILPQSYPRQQSAIAAVQIEKAGSRLASVLNRIFR